MILSIRISAGQNTCRISNGAKETMKTPKKMLSDLKEMGFKVVVSQDPVIAQANKKQWEEADRLGYFVKDNILKYKNIVFFAILSFPDIKVKFCFYL